MDQKENRLFNITEIERLVAEQLETLKRPLSPVEAVEYRQRTERINDLVEKIAGDDSDSKE